MGCTFESLRGLGVIVEGMGFKVEGWGGIMQEQWKFSTPFPHTLRGNRVDHTRNYERRKGFAWFCNLHPFISKAPSGTLVQKL